MPARLRAQLDPAQIGRRTVNVFSLRFLRTVMIIRRVFRLRERGDRLRVSVAYALLVGIGCQSLGDSNSTGGSSDEHISSSDPTATTEVIPTTGPPLNLPPTIDVTERVYSEVNRETSVFVHVDDWDGDTVEVTLKQAPPEASLTMVDPMTFRFLWTPKVAIPDLGSEEIIFLATDGTHEVEAHTSIRVDTLDCSLRNSEGPCNAAQNPETGERCVWQYMRISGAPEMPGQCPETTSDYECIRIVPSAEQHCSCSDRVYLQSRGSGIYAVFTITEPNVEVHRFDYDWSCLSPLPLPPNEALDFCFSCAPCGPDPNPC